MSEQMKLENSPADAGHLDMAAAARELRPLIRAHADGSERGRRLAAPVVDALRAAGLFTMGLPVSLGGAELPISPVLRAIEEVSHADGATGWNVMIAFDTGLWAGFINSPQARALIRSMAQPILAGSVNPPGRLTRTAGGYRLSGRWRFGSGCQQADAFLVGAVMAEDGNAAGAHGMSQLYEITLPAGDVKILDTWHVAGMRGTGSHDFAVEDLFVEEGLVEAINFDRPFEPGPLYRFGVVPSFAVVKTAVALGIARRAVEAFKELAAGKTPMGQGSVLRERPSVQADVARAEACIRSARAFLDEVVGEAWRTVTEGKPLEVEARAWLRLASVDGVQRAIDAVDLMFQAGGGTAIHESSPLERCFRDVHVVPAHIVVQPEVYEVAGRVLLGLPPRTMLF